MIVVSDASPLIALIRTDRLHLLCDLFQEVVVPPAVWAEVRAGRPGSDAADDLDGTCVRRRSLGDPSCAESLSVDLDPGEAEAICLAIELSADLVLLDEKRGRASARRLGLRIAGTVAVILEARARGLVTECRPILDDLRASGFWIDDDLYGHALEVAGET